METGIEKARPERLDWVDPLKALALLGILLNHFVECFGPGPWFTNPWNGWPDFATRMGNVFPPGTPLVATVRFLGWLGDSAPGVFILLSGFGLTYGTRNLAGPGALIQFYQRRLLRIYPLYWAMHIVILALAVFVPGNTQAFQGPWVFLSLMGLRLTPSLFFFISPSWWFVWLIIQLYAVFPFLNILLERAGLRRFLYITIAFTFLSRAFGIYYSGSLYYWMTGLFFGSRLAEFAAGMAVAHYLTRHRDALRLRGFPTVLGASSALYLAGLGCSFTYAGSIAANLLVTLGMTGLFYTAWGAWLKKSPAATRWINRVGAISYAVFLLHQPPLQWAAAASLPTGLRVTFALAVLLLSFPTAWLIEHGVTRLTNLVPARRSGAVFRSAGFLVAISMAACLYAIEPRLGSAWKIQVFHMILALSLAGLAILEYWRSAGETAGETMLRWSVLFAAGVKLFFLPQGQGFASLVVGAATGILSWLCYLVITHRVKAWACGIAACGIVCCATELGLRRFAPLEAGRWGEFPALEPHPTRVYALRPNQQTRLRYNNYDYVVRTNSLGLASPDIAIPRQQDNSVRILVVGDAFTMPEGLTYEYSYTALLQQELGRRLSPRKVEVVNAGVTGYGPVEELAQLRELTPLLCPDIVIYEFFINEFFEVNIEPADRLNEIGFGPRQSRLRSLVSEAQILAWAAQARTRIHERLSGKPASWRHGKALLDFYRTGANPLYTAENLSKLKWHLDKMHDVCTRTGARLLILFVPGAVAVSSPRDIDYFPWDVNLQDSSLYDLQRPWENLRQLTQALGIAAYDLGPFLKMYPQQPVYFPASWHWNPDGHRAVAAAVSGILALELTEQKFKQ
jgi:peptidoglycan/LPS O-acetylase OafA/YrhL